jgi:hypothetical protein
MEARFPRLCKGGRVHHGKEAILSGDSAEVGIYGGVGGSVSENDDAAGEPDGESGGDGGVGWFERVIPLCPYIPKASSKQQKSLQVATVSGQPKGH